MPIGDLFHDREAQTGAVGGGRIGAMEALEDPFSILGRDTGTIVGDTKDDCIRLLDHRDRHSLADASVANGVVDEVCEQFPEQQPRSR